MIVRLKTVSYTHLDVYKRQVQSISYSLLCRWFRTAVLPQDKELETALFHRMNAKKCAVCGALFTPGSNRAKYCPECAARMKRINACLLYTSHSLILHRRQEFWNAISMKTIFPYRTTTICALSLIHIYFDYR